MVKFTSSTWIMNEYFLFDRDDWEILFILHSNTKLQRFWLVLQYLCTCIIASKGTVVFYLWCTLLRQNRPTLRNQRGISCSVTLIFAKDTRRIHSYEFLYAKKSHLSAPANFTVTVTRENSRIHTSFYLFNDRAWFERCAAVCGYRISLSRVFDLKISRVYICA